MISPKLFGIAGVLHGEATNLCGPFPHDLLKLGFAITTGRGRQVVIHGLGTTTETGASVGIGVVSQTSAPFLHPARVRATARMSNADLMILMVTLSRIPGELRSRHAHSVVIFSPVERTHSLQDHRPWRLGKVLSIPAGQDM